MVKGKRLKVFGRRSQGLSIRIDVEEEIVRLSLFVIVWSSLFVIVISFRLVYISSQPLSLLSVIFLWSAHENVGHTTAFTFHQSNVFRGRSLLVWKASLLDHSFPFLSIITLPQRFRSIDSSKLD